MTILSPLFEPSPEQEQTLPSSRNLGAFPSKTTMLWLCHAPVEWDLHQGFCRPELYSSGFSVYTILEWSLLLCPEAPTCSRNVNHLRCFVTWSQVETPSNKNVNMSSPVLLCHPGLYCINYTSSFVQQSCSQMLCWDSPGGDSHSFLWGFGGGHLHLCCRETSFKPGGFGLGTETC